MDIDRQLEVIRRGAVEIISEDELRRKLEEGAKKIRPLTVKAGFDPTAPDIHLGHAVLLRKLRQFQELGHKVVFLIGDFTACIGDPSGKSEKRRQLTREEVRLNAETYKKQVGKILDLRRLRVVFNSAWFERMSVRDILQLTARATASQMFARADFRKRQARGEDISLIEFMYPLLQGYDSAVLEADIELGVTDQIFNLLVGRDIQKDLGKPQQVVITMPLLEGTDGTQKMSKSSGNYIGINETAQEMFGKLMSIPDALTPKYAELLTDLGPAELKALHPKEAKVKLAQDIIRQFHGAEAADKASREFERIFARGEIPSEMPEFYTTGDKTVLQILSEGGLTKSGNESRRLIREGAVTFNGQRVDAENFIPRQSGVLKAGPRRYLKVIVQS